MLKTDAHFKMNLFIDLQKYWLSQTEEQSSSFAEPGGGGEDLATDVSQPEHSETNTQVEGVDEADIVKTDGNFLYVLHGQQLEIINAWPVSELTSQASVAIEGHPLEMFLADDHIVVYSRVDAQPVYDAAGVEPPVSNYGYGYGDSYYMPSLTKITVLGLDDGGGATVAKEHYFEGDYTSSRRIDNRVRTVIGGYGYGLALDYSPDYWGSPMGYWGSDTDKLMSAYESLRFKNLAIIAGSDLDDYLAQSFQRKDGEMVVDAPSCEGFYVPTKGSTAEGFTTIHAMDLGALDQDPVTTSVIGSTDTVYSSKDAMYVAAQGWHFMGGMTAGFGGLSGSASNTHIHKFDIATDPAVPTHVASTTIPGRIHDQFSLDEHDGVLRVAVTQDLVAANTWGATSNALYTFDAELGAIGQVDGLAPNEQIYSARFVGDRGYVVTFRQVDPLFVFDLSDPHNPTKLGELKIPGFSTYMHPIEDGKYLLTVGHDGTDQGQILEPALQIFDVTDPTKPTLVHKETLPDGWSEAESNHKAFTYYNGMLAIPFSSWNGSSAVSTLELFSIDVVDGIHKLASIDHAHLYGDVSQQQYYCGYYGHGVRRGVFIDDYIYSISSGGVVVNELADMGTVASLQLSALSSANDCYY